MNKPVLFEDYYDISAAAYCDNPSLMIPLGVNHHGVLEQAEITEKHGQHILVAGHAGSGKSNYLRSVLASLLLNYSADQLNIWLEDVGMCEFDHFARSAPAHIMRVNTCSSPESYIAFADALEAEITSRLRFLSNAEKTSFYSWYLDHNKPPFPRLIVVIDGFDHFMRSVSEVNPHYIGILKSIAGLASICGITFIVSTQNTSFLTRYIDKSFFELFGIRISTKQDKDSHWALFGNHVQGTTDNPESEEAIVNEPSIRKLLLLYLAQNLEEQIRTSVLP